MLNLRTVNIIVFLLAFYNFTFSQTIYLSSDNSSSCIHEKFEIRSNQDTIIKGFYKNDSLAYQYKLFQKKPSGTYKVYHINGRIKYTGVFVNGKLNGLWKEYSPTGKLIVSGSFNKGTKDGSWYYFDKERVEIYSKGVANGRWRVNQGWTPRTLLKYKNGVLIETKTHFPQNHIFH